MKADYNNGPVREALRISGVSVVLDMRDDGSMEVGYPIDLGRVEFQSTGVVCADGTFAPPTQDAWSEAERLRGMRAQGAV